MEKGEIIDSSNDLVKMEGYWSVREMIVYIYSKPTNEKNSSIIPFVIIIR